MTRYEELLARLLALARGRQGRLDLSIMLLLCRELSDPHSNFPTVHIAGTNGKGSVSTMVAAGLSSCHPQVGLYTSPHLSSFRERIQVNSTPITAEEVEELLPPILAAVERLSLAASFFEVTTMLAFSYFAARKVDIAVIETGLGGRLDATNIIAPLLSVITSISADHTEILGSSLEEIAREKAGIIKPHTPAIIGPSVPVDVIEPIASIQQSPLYCVEGIFHDYREENRAVAAMALKLLGIEKVAIKQALMAVPPCRFERCRSPEGVDVIFDVAHNPVGLQRLSYLIHELWGDRRCHAVIAISATKELESCLAPLQRVVSRWYPVAADNGRSYPPSSIAAALERQGVAGENIALHVDISAATAYALASAVEEKAPLLICGSFFIMAQARRSLSIVDVVDPYDLNEWTSPRL